MRKLFILFSLVLPSLLSAQAEENILNPFVEYTNESIHGMLIIHRMLENFNQQLNQYVDLESTQVNFYGNADLPKNIFEDIEHLFYDVTPYEWYDVCKQKTQRHPQLQGALDIIVQMKRCTDEMNQLRFELENTIKTVNLDQSQNQKLVYKKLNRGESLYNEFFDLKTNLETTLIDYKSGFGDPLINSLSTLHDQITALFTALRNRDEKRVAQYEDKLASCLASIPAGGGSELKEIKVLSQGLIDDLKEYLSKPEMIDAYRQYGYFYYYHNVKMINKVNRYGNGMVHYMNQIMRKRGSVDLFMEIPHYYKVIYPRKEEVTPYIASTKMEIDDTPEKLESRLVIAHEQAINVDHVQVEFLLYDHKEQDGDVLSMNFNGDWVLENYALTTKPFPLKLSLNPSGKNYLILHAVNTGSRPPNTVALSYYYKGKRKQIILNSDLNTSEMIELRLDDTDN